MRRTGIIVGTAAIAALATGGVLAASGGAQAPTGQTIQVIERSGPEKFVDVAPKAKRNFDASAGDQFLFSYPLVNTSNAHAGTLDVDCKFTKGGKKPRGFCTGVMSLTGGDLFLEGRLSISGDTKGAIAGGTGDYAGARGTFVSVDTKGGDHDTITLLP